MIEMTYGDDSFLLHATCPVVKVSKGHSDGVIDGQQDLLSLCQLFGKCCKEKQKRHCLNDIVLQRLLSPQFEIMTLLNRQEKVFMLHVNLSPNPTKFNIFT